MKRFLRKLAVFAVPFIAYGAAVVVLDPYNRFDVTHLAPNPVKRAIALPANYALWTVLDFDRDPSPNILLGDSKMNRLDPSVISEVSGSNYRNLAMGGASSVEMINLFWHASHRIPLKSVYIGINLENLNRFNNRDRVMAAAAVESNSLLYFSSRDVAVSSWRLLKHLALRGPREMPISLEHPPMSKEAFWKEELEYGATRNFYGYKFDERAFEMFREIASYCREHGISLHFIVLPTHADLHGRIRDFGLEAEWRQVPVRFHALAPTADLDTDNALTADRSNFSDPYHMTFDAAKQVVDIIWSRDRVR